MIAPKMTGVVLVALMVMASSMFITADAAPTNLSSEITTELSNTTDGFGGGSHFYVMFGDDAVFGVVWGNEENPNNVYIVSYSSQYLGNVDVHDGQGNLIREGHMVKVYGLYAVKLDSLIEFSDGTGDGVVRYYRTYDPDTGKYSDYHALRPGTEPLYKRVSLNTTWEASEPVLVEDGANKSWTLSLTARNLTYEAILDGASIEGVLDNVTLTFQLDASTVHKDNIEVPQYSVNVTNGQFSGLQQEDNKTYSGNVTSYNLKWSKEIEGWDFDASNEHPALLLELESVAGKFIPSAATAVMALNQYRIMIQSMGDETQVRTANEAGTAYNGSTGSLTANKQALTSASLSFGSAQNRMASFSWAQNCTVDGTEQYCHAQMMSVHSVHAYRWGGMQFYGLAVLSGISFPGGSYIYQDPTVSAEAVTDLAATSSDTVDNSTGLFGSFGLAIVGVIAAVVLVGAVLVMRRKGGQNGPMNYEKKDDKEQDDWSQYYEKK